MKVIIYCNVFILLFFQNSLDWKEVMRDFQKGFNPSRFSKAVRLTTNNFEDNIFDSTTLTSDVSKKKTWSAIHIVIGRCDYIAQKDSTDANSFFIFSDKAYEKFWVKYDSRDKISAIKIIRPKITGPRIAPPCGY